MSTTVQAVTSPLAKPTVCAFSTVRSILLTVTPQKGFALQSVHSTTTLTILPISARRSAPALPTTTPTTPRELAFYTAPRQQTGLLLPTPPLVSASLSVLRATTPSTTLSAAK